VRGRTGDLRRRVLDLMRDRSVVPPFLQRIGGVHIVLIVPQCSRVYCAVLLDILVLGSRITAISRPYLAAVSEGGEFLSAIREEGLNPWLRGSAMRGGLRSRQARRLPPSFEPVV